MYRSSTTYSLRHPLGIRITALLFVWDVSSPLIANNIIIGGTTLDGVCLLTSHVTDAFVLNNVLTGCALNIWSNSSRYRLLDNNVYHGATLDARWRLGKDYFFSLEEWRKASGGDTAGRATTDSLSLGDDGKPASVSVVIDAGANLTNLRIDPLNSDRRGVAKQTVGPWPGDSLSP